MVLAGESDAVLIDGDVAKFICQVHAFQTLFHIRSVVKFVCLSMYAARLLAGQPFRDVPDGYVDYEGYTNSLVTFTDGTIGMVKAKLALQDAALCAGAEPLSSVFTPDLAGIYATHQPSGELGSIKTPLIGGTGRMQDGGWFPTGLVVSRTRPKLKLDQEQIVTEGTSVFVTP
jgi:hypothetical protein